MGVLRQVYLSIVESTLVVVIGFGILIGGIYLHAPEHFDKMNTFQIPETPKLSYGDQWMACMEKVTGVYLNNGVEIRQETLDMLCGVYNGN